MQPHILRLAARSMLRHRARTLLTAGMVAMSVMLLIVALSWVNGVFGEMLSDATSMSGHVRIVTKEYAAREQLAPLYENLQPMAPLVELLERQPGVVSVQPRITTGVTVTVGEEIGEVFALLVGAPYAYYRDHIRAEQHLAEGRWFSGEGEVVMGHRVARQAGAKPGDEVVLLGMTQDGSLSPLKATLTGILSGGNSFLDQQIFLPLEPLQWMTDIPGGAIEILVFGERYQEAAGLARSLRRLPELAEPDTGGVTEQRGDGPMHDSGSLDVQAWSERDPWAGVLKAVGAVQGTIVFFIVLLAALGVLNTMMMSVLERTSEIGVLRAMGLGRLGVLGIFLSEAAAIAVAGGLAGVLMGVVPARFLEVHGIRLGEDVANSLSAEMPISAVVHGDLTPGIVAAAFALGLFTAVLGSLLPAARAAGIQPVVAMRTKR